jgi:O-antigen/teichoic acid export membrane protein/SAM-dependent methyltransferase
MPPPVATSDGRSNPTAEAGPLLESSPLDALGGAGSESGVPSDHHRLSHDFLAQMGGRFTRHTAIYAMGQLAIGPFSLISVMVLTRVLNPSQYGELALLFFFSGYLTTLYNTGSLHGTFMLVYGTSEGEGDEVDSDASISMESRRALGTGMVLTLMIVTAGTVVCVLLAPDIARLMLNRSSVTLVLWAAAYAAAGSLWRLAVTVFRMERQPTRYAALNAMRPLFVVAGSVPLVLLGFGVEGALAGTVLGTLAAAAVCIAMARHSYALAFSRADAREIIRRGSLVVVPVVALFAVHNGDVALLSLFASAHAVGVYRVASRFAAVPSYFASAFLMAWAPLEHGVLFQATYRHVGEERVRGKILTYYLLASATIVLLLDVGARGLMLLAGPADRSAAPLIPLIGVGFVCYGLFIVLVRIVKLEKRRMLFYSGGAVLSVVLDVVLSIVLIPQLGAYGLPLATICAMLITCALWIAAVKILMKASISFEPRPLIGLAAAVAIAVAVQAVGLQVWPAGRPVVMALVLVSYLGAVYAFSVVPRRHLGLLRRLTGVAVRRGIGGTDPTSGLARLSPARRNVLAAIERDRTPLNVLAERLGWPERRVQSEYVGALRELIGAAAPDAAAFDAGIADYLLSKLNLARRDILGRELVEEGVEALELMELDEVAKLLRAHPHEQWPVGTGAVLSQGSGRTAPSERRGLSGQLRRSTRAAGRAGSRRPVGTSVPPAFAGVARDLRDGIIEHHEQLGEHLDTPTGRLTLETNSVLAAERGRTLLRLLAEQGMGSVEGLRVLELGAGFGALALYFAHLGAEVVAVDPSERRLRVALEIARRRGLNLSTVAADALSLPFADASFDLVVANNAICRIVDRGDRHAALEDMRRVLRPGGWVAMRNPNRLHHRDHFTGLPLLPLLPAPLARRVTLALGRHRSEVQLLTPWGAVRQLRRAGFAHAHWRPHPGQGLRDMFAGFHHVVARLPALVAGGDLLNPALAFNGSAAAFPAPIPLDSGVSAPPAPPAGGAPAAAVSVPTPASGPPSPSTLHPQALLAWLRAHWEATLYGSMALVFIWMRLIDMQISLWDDEAATVVQYINRGPAGIYSSANYTPNDHILYSLLSWMTVGVLGRTEPTYRIWSVFPAILSAVLLVVWARRRLGRATGLALAAMLLTAPYLLYETVQARGYGLAQLGMVLVLIAAIEIEEHGPRRWSLAALASGIVVGPASHAMTAVGVVCVIAFLRRRRDLRRPVLKASAIGGVCLAVIVAPLAPAMVSQAQKWFIAGPHDTRSAAIKSQRPPLPASSPVVGPIDLGIYTGELLETGKIKTSCSTRCLSPAKAALPDAPLLICAILGVVALWWRRRRGLLGCLLVALVGGFALPTLARSYVAPRFVLYLLPAYALLAAVGIAAVLTWAARRRIASKSALAALALAALIFGGLRMYEVNESWGQRPGIDYRGMADAFAGTGIPHAVTNAPPNVAYGLTYYLGSKVSYAKPALLREELCGSSAPFAFVQLAFAITPEERNCLVARGASSLDFHGSGNQLLRLWVIQSPGLAHFTPRVTGEPTKSAKG